MVANRVTLVQDQSGDWEGLYIDYALVTESHSLESLRILKLLESADLTQGIRVDFMYTELDVGSRLPAQLGKGYYNKAGDLCMSLTVPVQ